QNTTPAQMKMFLTRMGYGAKLVITGDPTQTDLPPAQRSGLRDALDLVHGIRGIGIIQFSDADVVRHPLVAALIRAYHARDGARSPRVTEGEGGARSATAEAREAHERSNSGPDEPE